MDKTYHYYAFISYSTADSKWAKWLQHKLSYYHIPNSIEKSKIGIPSKIRPIFIYEYDLSGNQLHTAINQELEASKYLIVICSPNASNSKYVNWEVETFIQMGRSKYIIPFIVDGEVNSLDSTRECFPPNLLSILNSGDNKNELRGINVMTNGKHHALVDIVATMLGVRRDVLWDRYKIRRLKQRIMMAMATILVLLCGLFYWDYTRPTYRYYTDYVDVWGVPTGIIELNKVQVKHRNESYRFEYRRIPLLQPNAYNWRLVKVTHINSAGNPTPTERHIDRYSIQKLTYNPDNGILTDITYYNELEKPQIIHNLSRNSGTPATIVDLESVIAGDGASFAKSISTIIPNKSDKTSNITRYIYERNAEGYITKISYHANNSRDFNSSATADNFGVWGIRYELDSLGRRKTIHYLNKDGTYHYNKIGVSSLHYNYDNLGNTCTEYTLDAKGNLILNEHLFAIALETYNNGNCIEVSYYGIDGKPCLNNLGVAKWTAKYDDRGNRIEEYCYGIDGKPCLNNLGVAKHTAKYDDRGNRIEESYYGIDGKPCLNNNLGVAKGTTKYDDRGNRIELSYYGIDGKPCLDNLGVAKETAKYDDQGNFIEVSYYGIDGKPCLSNLGVAKYTAKYDDRGNRIEEYCYGVDGKPCLNNLGVAKWTAKYDDRGNCIESSYYGVDGKPCLNNLGIAKGTAKYDDQGNRIEEYCYGVDGKPCLNNLGVAKYTAKYDDRGNCIESSYYGIDGKPCLNNLGVAKWTAKYDDRGNCIESSYYGIDGKPCLNNLGVAKHTAKYDDRGNCIEKYCYGIDGKPCLNNLGVAKWTAKYDDRGNCIEESYYGINGKPCLNNNLGVAKGTAKYDDRGNCIESSYYGVDGKPCLNNLGVAKYTAKYDVRGNCIEESYYGIDGKPCLNNFGVAKHTAKYDVRGNRIEEYCYGVDGKPCLSKYDKLLKHKSEILKISRKNGD